jgi:hypothetical protein
VNLPLARIHDSRSSYGRLLLPLPFSGGRWLAAFDDKGLRLTDRTPGGFHNCSWTGVH